MNINPKVSESISNWVKKFTSPENCPEMDQDTTMAMLSILQHEDRDPDEEVKEIFPYKVIMQRSSYLGLSLTNGFSMFLLLISNGRPGSIAMFLTVLKYKLLTNAVSLTENTKFGMKQFVDVFPMGFPNEEKLSTLWDEQKGHPNGVVCDNMVDIAFVE